MDRDLYRTGNSIVTISPCTGVFEVSSSSCSSSSGVGAGDARISTLLVVLVLY